MFIRVYRDNKKTEVVYNLDHVSQIEVKYGILDSGSGIISRIHPIDATNCDDAIRSYKLYIAGDEILLAANPDCPVMKAIENIYINSLKGD